MAYLWAFLFIAAWADVTDELSVLVDEPCMRSRGDYHWLALNGIQVQHKTSAPMRIKAMAMRVAHPDQLNLLNSMPCVLDVTPNHVVESAAVGPDPRVGEQTFRAVLAADEAERIFFHPLFGIQKPVVVAVLDTGVELFHEDLMTRLWRGPNGELGYDFRNGDADPSDDSGHGTHVAGLIGAQRLNQLGVRGVMGDQVQIMPIKTQDASGTGRVTDVVNGIYWAVDQGADVINLSLTVRGRNTAIEGAIDYALSRGVAVVSAAGNGNELLSDTNFLAPACYAKDKQGLLSVGSFDAQTVLKSSFSNYGPEHVELMAPGSSGTSALLSTYRNNSYLGVEGTSQATPIVSGAAALAVGFLRSQYLNFTPADIEQWLTKTSVQDGNLSSFSQSGRRVELRKLGEGLINATVIQATGGFDDR